MRKQMTYSRSHTSRTHVGKGGRVLQMDTRTTRLVFSYYDRISTQWGKDTWSRTIRNAARRGVAESLLEERLQIGANKGRKGLFEGSGEGMEEDHIQLEQNWRVTVPDKCDVMSSGNSVGNGFRRRSGTGW
jgi:hypothetical protein